MAGGYGMSAACRMDAVRRVRVGRVLAASVMVCVGVAALSAQAGAAGRHHALRRTFHASSSGVRSGAQRSVGTHGIAPLTSFVGTTYFTDANGSTREFITPAITGLTAFGTTTIDGNALTAAVQGDQSGSLFNPVLTIGIVTPGNAPLTAGSVYSTDSGSTFSVHYPVSATSGAGCRPGVDPNSPGAVEVDQVVYTAGVPTVLAFQFDLVCDLGVMGSLEFVGTAAINITPTTPGQGYYLFDSYGGLGGFGNDSYLNYLGDLTQLNLRAPVVAMATTPSGAGYWMTAGDGGVFSYGDAAVLRLDRQPHPQPTRGGHGGDPGRQGLLVRGVRRRHLLLRGRPLLRLDGRAAPQQADRRHGGDPGRPRLLAGGVRRRRLLLRRRQFYGSTGNLTLNQPVVGMAATSDGKGYWFVASDGGVFSYGDARFFGSTGNIQLAEPVVAMSAAPDDRGYWFTASDGGVFGFGSAPYEGGLGGQGYTDIVGMAR